MRRNPLRNLHQQRVADRMRVVIVDVLEIVDVDEGERKARHRPVVGEKLLDVFLNRGAVRQRGKIVEIGALR